MTNTKYPFEDSLTEKNVLLTDLPEKTQKLIAKFNEEADEEKREALDEKIFGDVEDFVEEREKKAKEEAKKKKHQEAKKKVVDVSSAPTAAIQSNEKQHASVNKKEEEGVMRFFRRK